MDTKETTFYFNYKPLLIVLVGCLTVFGVLFLYATSMIPVVLIIGFGFFVTYMVTNQVEFFKVTVFENDVIAKPWFSAEKKLFDVTDLKEVHIEKSDSFAFASLVIKNPDSDVNERRSFNLNAYRIMHGVNSNNKTAFEEKLKSLVDKDKLTIHEQDSITNTETGKALRCFVWFGVLVYAIKLYVDLMVLKGIHFSTMNVLPYSWIVIVIVSLLCFINIRNRTKKNDYLTSVLVGVILGWVLTVSISTFVKWHNENNTEIVTKNYEFVLDDYDEPINEQRWLVSEEAQALIKRERIYLDGRGRAYEMNTKLAEDKTYSIPVAVGKFNDVFLPKDAFLKAKEIND